MSENSIIHVKPHNKGWQVKRKDASRASAVEDTKQKAMKVAKRYLDEKSDVDKIVEYRKDGTVVKDKPDRTIIHVKTHDNGWQIIREGAGRASAVEDTKKEAVEKAKRYLGEFEDVSKLIIHKTDGSVSRTQEATTSKKYRKLTKEEKYDTAVYKTSDLEIEYDIWHKDLQDSNPLSENHIGDKVHVVGESPRRQTFLHNVHSPGEEMWPDGGYEVYWRTKDYITCHFFEEVRLHKSEKKNT